MYIQFMMGLVPRRRLEFYWDGSCFPPLADVSCSLPALGSAQQKLPVLKDELERVGLLPYLAQDCTELTRPEVFRFCVVLGTVAGVTYQ